MNSAKILDGKSLAKTRRDTLHSQISSQTGRRAPRLDVIWVGENPASKKYIEMKKRVAQKIGIDFEVHHFDAKSPADEVIKQIEELNGNEDVDGVMVQLPLPKIEDMPDITDSISVEKDVDGLTSANLGRLFVSDDAYLSATAKAIVSLASLAIESFVGLDVAIINDTKVVGLPVAAELNRRGATVTVCHKHTRDLPHKTSHADLLISATGVAGLVGAEYLKEGAVVIDAGIDVDPEGKVMGDVQYESVLPIASAITPVPGGVGPMTVISLMENTYEAWSRKML